MLNRQFGHGYRFGFNGKEQDNEVEGKGSILEYGARIYDPRIGRFFSVDPLTKKFAMLTPYQYATNTPIQAVDLGGLEAFAVYNKATSMLAIIPDISQTQPKLNYKFVGAFEYAALTPADKAKYNYGIVVKGVFTGGHSENGAIVHGDPNRPKEKPISTGDYNILENKGNTNPAHSNFFVLDPKDEHPYDKVDDRPGEINSDGDKRSGYNLHPGQISWGCVTVSKDAPDMTPAEREKEWNIVYDAVSKTKTVEVPDNRGLQKYVYGSTQTKFGTLRVIDEAPAAKTQNTPATPAVTPPTPATPDTSARTN